MDEPDRVTERLTLHDGEVVHLVKHTENLISFQKTHDFRQENWYLVYRHLTDPLDKPLDKFSKQKIGEEREIDLDIARQTWSILLNNGWERATDEEIKANELNLPYITGSYDLNIDGNDVMNGAVVVDTISSDALSYGYGWSSNTVTSGQMDAMQKRIDDLEKEIQTLKEKA